MIALLLPAASGAAERTASPRLSVVLHAGATAPGQDMVVSGRLLRWRAQRPQPLEARTTFHLRIRAADGATLGHVGPFETDATGRFRAPVPGELTAGIRVTELTDWKTTLALDVVDVSYSDASGRHRAAQAGSGAVTLAAAPPGLQLENSFVSAVGWVKPGERYPFRIIVRNPTKSAIAGARVTVARVPGAKLLRATPTKGSGRAGIRRGRILWRVGKVPAAQGDVPGTKTLIGLGRAKTTRADPRVVWKDLSSKALLRWRGDAGPVVSWSHGPKVIPPDPVYDSARYGDRPFPVVPVDYFDRTHEEEHSGEVLARVVNSKDYAGSTFNLYQEMSLTQLFPQGTVPSAGIATADFDVKFESEHHSDGFEFTQLQPQGSCHGTTQRDAVGTPLYSERIRDGWYQLPGTTDYYGDDKYGSALPGAIVPGAGSLQSIDDACGPAGKAVYDAAHIADPEIDYSNYDTNKDGVVDFFMLIFVGRGGHGASQTSAPPYDNIWPHSWTLEDQFRDPETGLTGYVSDDRLRDLQGRLLYYRDKSLTQMTTRKTEFPVYVRVGPYNVNPENSIDRASVISHEYGHSLGLPDYYSIGDRETYGDWNLMASDKSQHMDVYTKQELGWIVPRVLNRNTERTIRNWRDSKINTHRIDWRTPSGRRYTLKGKRVDNAEAYVAKLPARHVIDPKKVEETASKTHVWWSGSGNRFGCTPAGGHNLDIYLPEIEDLAPGTPITLSFKSYWEIAWDDDYGFMMVTNDNGETYRSLPSERGYTTPALQNPQNNSCQALYGNGVTGTSGSYAAGTAPVDRSGPTPSYPDGPFLEDEYDLTETAGQPTVIRLSYYTDNSGMKKGWFIDDLVITADINGDEKVLFESNFERREHFERRMYNGGCKDDLTTATHCTVGWSYIRSSAASPADHAYYMEMRDRSGFDADGHLQSDRGPIAFLAGLLLVYTDEAHGYGNSRTPNPPAQSPLDSQPEPGNLTPDLHDAAWTAYTGDTTFSDFGAGHVDNYQDPSPEPGREYEDDYWHFQFGCLKFTVLSMFGNAVGPPTVPGDLVGTVKVTTGPGCGKFNYGYKRRR